MEEQEKVGNILKMVEEITKNYFEENTDADVSDLKEILKEFVTNPLFANKLVFQLREKMSGLNKVDDFLWNSIEDEINKYYSKSVRKLSPLYEGRVREYEKRLVELIKQFGVGKGQTPTVSMVLSYLLLHEESGLTQQQLKELTGLSMGSISSNLKTLERALVKTLIKGTRTYKYSLITIPGGSIAELAFKAGEDKKKKTNDAIKYVERKISQLEAVEMRDLKGAKSLINRLDDLLKYLLVRREIIEDLSQEDELIGKITSKFD